MKPRIMEKILVFIIIGERSKKSKDVLRTLGMRRWGLKASTAKYNGVSVKNHK